MSDLLNDPRRFRHDWADHEYLRFLNTGGPIKAYCGHTFTAESYRSTTVCGDPLPRCPHCIAVCDRNARKAAA